MNKKPLPYCKAICYSGYRDGQSPESGDIPTYDQVKQDLLILQGQWQSLRLYASDAHSETVLAVIRNERMSFDVMLGAYITAEVNNEACPWGGVYSPEQLLANKEHNLVQINRLVELTNAYADIVSSVSLGNEASVSWTDHMVTTESLVRYARLLKKKMSLNRSLSVKTMCHG